MKIWFLVKWLLIGFLVQIVAFACYCPRYIQLYQLSDLIQIKTFGLDTLDGVYKYFGFTDTEYSGDSLFIKMNPTIDFNGEIELESYLQTNKPLCFSTMRS